MWEYQQSTGRMSQNGMVRTHGYSGNRAGLNNPEFQEVPDVGPVPQGEYIISRPFLHPTKGPVVMHLSPKPANQMFGRSGFLIHGDNSAMNHTASEGCIILARVDRQMIADSLDPDLTVIA